MKKQKKPQEKITNEMNISDLPEKVQNNRRKCLSILHLIQAQYKELIHRKSKQAM